MNFIKRSVLLSFVLVAPIGAFYSPNFPLYVLGDLREESITTWVLLNTALAGGLGIIAVMLYSGTKMRSPVIIGLLLALTGLAVIHSFPTLLYWDTFIKDGIVRDDIGTLGPKANVFMLLWHVIIVAVSIVIGMISLAYACRRSEKFG